MSPAAPQARVCPDCGCAAIRRSRRSGMADRLRSVFSRFPYRCRECNRRFRLKTLVGRRPVTKRTGRAGNRRRRRGIQTREALLYGIALLAFAIVAFLVTGERS